MIKHKEVRKSVLSYLFEHGWFIQSIETSMTGEGVPDSVVCKDGKVIWIEYKVVDCSWPDVKRPIFEQAQLPWMIDYQKHGGKSVIVTRIRQGYVITVPSQHDIHTGRYCTELRSVLYLSTLAGPVFSDWLHLI